MSAAVLAPFNDTRNSNKEPAKSSTRSFEKIATSDMNSSSHNAREGCDEKQLQANLDLITTLNGPKDKKDFKKRLKQVAATGDKRDVIQFYNLLNRKPYKKKQDPKYEAAAVALIKASPDLCLELYRFEAFSRDLLHPLHMLCALNASAATIKACYKACEAALFHDDSKLGAPIHYAVTFNAAFDVIRWLVKKDADALLVRNTALMTPLHLASLYEANADTVAFLSDRCPAAAATVDRDGMTPLHLACSGEEPDVRVTEDLTEVCPQACLVVAKDGSTPLLAALSVSAEPAVLTDLIVSNPQATEICSPKGLTPLHMAIEKEVDFAVIKDLVRAGPRQLQLTDKHQNLPMHTAVKCRCNMSVYQLLARKFPDALEAENEKGLTPTLYAQQLGLDDEIVQFLNPFEEVED